MSERGTSGTDVVIVGGGVIGICVAYYLARSGVGVTVVERDQVGQGASYGNAGCIAPGHGAMNKPGRIKQALKSVFDPLSPLYVAPRVDTKLFRWLVEFSRYCTHEHVKHSMGVLGPLGHASVELFGELIADEHIDCDYRHEGYYDIFVTEAGLEATQFEVQLARDEGYHPERVSGDELRHCEPSISPDVIGGVHYPEAGTVNPHRFVTELAARAQRLGVEILSGTNVTDVVVAGGRVTGVRTSDGATVGADMVVLAAGAYTGSLARKMGLRLPLQPAKGYHRDRDPEQGSTPDLRITCMLGEKSVFCTPMSGFVRFAGTLEFSGLNHDIRRPRLEQLTNAAGLYLQGMGMAEPTSEWCGLRPCMSDGLPAIGPAPGYGGLFLATGHAMLGLTLGPATGRMIAQMIAGGDVPGAAVALSPERF